MKDYDYRTFEGRVNNKDPNEEYVLEYCPQQKKFHVCTMEERLRWDPYSGDDWIILFRGTYAEEWRVEQAMMRLWDLIYRDVKKKKGTTRGRTPHSSSLPWFYQGVKKKGA